MNILVVDDSRVSRMYIKEQVESLNYNVVGEAKDGVEGLALFENLKPEIIIADIEMPKMDGIEMTKKIYENNKNVKIIIITSVVNKKTTQKAILSGAFIVLKKPIETKQLAKALSREL